MIDPAMHDPSLMRSEKHDTPRYTMPNNYMVRSVLMSLVQPSTAKCSRHSAAKIAGGSPKKVNLVAFLRKGYGGTSV